MNKKNFSILILCILQMSCNGWQITNTKESYKNVPVQPIDNMDSILIIQTLKEWSKANWWTFEDYSKMYYLENKDVQYFIERVFYDDEKKKIIVWYGEKLQNASSIENYSNDKKLNRICPSGADTIYSMSALIGFRDNINEIWNLFPFENQSASCSPNKERALLILEFYFFNKMKEHKMWRVVQNGEKKGELELKEYGNNLQDESFWEKCWLWEKDSINSNNLYPFQVESYKITGENKLNRIAKPFEVPKIIYTDEILNNYK
ncbi:MAG: hypothetical protein ACKVQV_08085 [Bacteroidia bacterium]